MGNWKDELKKFVGRLASGQTDSRKNKRDSNESDSASNRNTEEGWKEGAAPLKKQGNRLSPEEVTRPKRKDSHSLEHPKETVKLEAEQTAAVTSPPPASLKTETGQTSNIRQTGEIRPSISISSNLEDAPECPLSAECDFRYPAEWVEAGRHLQPSEESGGVRLPIRIGLDFGTAYTKAAIKLSDSAFVVDFNGVTAAESSYLLAGEISEDAARQVWLGRLRSAERVLSRLKLPFISTTTTSLEAQAAAAVFLAWTIRYIRAWTFKHHAPLISGRRIVWEVNLGIPSSSWADKSLTRRYEKVANTAWLLSRDAATPTIARARELILKGIQPLEAIGLDGLQFIPEFVAQLAGYVMSPQRPSQGNELHLLVDAGAGTLDIACFGAWKPPREDLYRFETWAAAVVPLGTHFLMHARSNVLAGENSEWDDSNTIPSAGEFADAYGVPETAVLGADEEFRRQATNEIGAVLRRTKKSRNPRASEWNTGLRTFLAGGGSSVTLYQNAVAHALARVRSKQKNIEFSLFDVVDREKIPRSMRHRLSVAHGLTFDALSIGEAIPISDIDDIEDVARRRERFDRDELYPK